MCFKNLPIEFDAHGKARLKSQGDRPPFEVTPAKLAAKVTDYAREDNPGHNTGHNPGQNPGGVTTAMPPSGNIVKDHVIDPVTRVAGALAFHAKCDLTDRKIYETHSMATLFRGYELILKGRDPRDAIDISSRACGVCGGVHSTCASLTLEMAFGIKAPPMGVCVRNLGETAEFLYDHPLHMFLLAGPDYSASAFKVTNPEILERAQKTAAPHADLHGYRTIGDILEALNPLTGQLYLDAFEVTRVAREMCAMMYGKYPHPSTLVPGGVSTTLSFTSFNEYYTRLVFFFDYAKKVAKLWDDVYDFLLEANPEYGNVGRRPANIIDLGIFDDPESYDATYRNCSKWGEQRWATPGVIIEGELRTTDLVKINIGIEEFIEHSFYAPWPEPRFKTDPLGNPLSPYHPWNKQTIPKPVGRNWQEKYTWATAPRWDRTAMESGGPLSRQWITAVAKKIPKNDFIEATGTSLIMRLPKAKLPEMVLEWKVPKFPSAIERNRARAYHVAFCALVAMNNWLKATELWRKGETKTASPYEIPKKGVQLGVGFWGAGRGYLSHHMVLENGRIANYQILTPSTWMASPKDPWGKPGPYEEAVINTPILEKFADPKEFKGIDILRAVRSFDPCMPCTTHVYAGERVIVRDVNTCACTLDDN